MEKGSEVVDSFWQEGGEISPGGWWLVLFVFALLNVIYLLTYTPDA